MFENKGQTSIELLVLLAIAILALTATMVVSLENMKNMNEIKERNEANNAIMDLSGAAKEVYAQGVGAKKLVYVVIPSSYDPTKSSVGNKAIRLNSRGNDFVAIEDFRVRGSLPGTAGPHWVWVISEGDQVRIGEAMIEFDKNRIYVVMYPNSTVTVPFTVNNTWTQRVNVTTDTIWTTPDIGMSGVPSNFSLHAGNYIIITLQFTSGLNSSGFYFGKIDFNATDQAGANEMVDLPIIVEVVPPGQPLYPTWDIQGPVIDSIYQDPMPALKSQRLSIFVNVSDVMTGNSTITGCQIDADSAYNWQDMLPEDGAFDQPVEVAKFDYTSGFALGPHVVSVKCTDAIGNVGPKAYYYFEVKEYDTLGPIVLQLSHTAFPTTLSNVTITGTATDAYTGGSNLSGCQVKVGVGGTWTDASADDGAWSNISENFTYEIPPLGVGSYTVYVQCTDSLGNVGGVYTDTFGVVDIDLMLALDRSGSMAENVTNVTSNSIVSASSSGWSWAKDLDIPAKNGNTAYLSVEFRASVANCMASYNVTADGVTLATGNRTSTSYGVSNTVVDVSSLYPPYTISLYLKRNASGCTAYARSVSLQQPPLKIDAAKSGANSFLDIAGNNLQAGLVSYSSSATTDRTLAMMSPANQQALRNSINAMSPSGWTCIECALKNSANELTSARARPTANKVIVLLTDGIGNRGADGSECYTECSVAGATYARDRNITVYTIGFGSDVDDSELLNIALLTHGDYYYAPNAQTLTAIFQSIGRHQ